jgi:hypothetical protein
MLIELSREEITILRDLFHQKVLELDKEINRTDSLTSNASCSSWIRRSSACLASSLLHPKASPQP